MTITAQIYKDYQRRPNCIAYALAVYDHLTLGMTLPEASTFDVPVGTGTAINRRVRALVREEGRSASVHR